MGWFSNDYDKDYDRAAGYDRSRRDAAWGWGGGGYSGGQYGNRGRWGTSYGRPGYGGESMAGRGGYSSWRQPDTAFGQNRYGYDYEYRRPPEQSPTYGRGGDQAVQRWARRYGYDFGYEIEPNQRGGIQRGYERGNRGGYSGERGGYTGSREGSGFRSGQMGGRGRGRGYDREFRW
jgi:hypothetical protein